MDIGRLVNEDNYLGNQVEPLSRNRYIYGQNTPVNYVDPSGNVSLKLPKPKVPSPKEMAKRQKKEEKKKHEAAKNYVPAGVAAVGGGGAVATGQVKPKGIDGLYNGNQYSKNPGVNKFHQNNIDTVSFMNKIKRRIMCEADKGKAQSQPQKQENGVGAVPWWGIIPVIPGIGTVAKVVAPYIPGVAVVVVVGVVVYEVVDWLIGGSKPKDTTLTMPTDRPGVWTDEKEERLRSRLKIAEDNTTQGKSRAPAEGEPGSTYEQVDDKGNVMSRTKYGPNGKPEYRDDFNHPYYDKNTQEDLQPHRHIYKYNDEGYPVKPDVPVEPVP